MKSFHLPHGYGSIRFLGGGRTKPYAVHLPEKNAERPKAICYVSDWFIGFAVLTAWHAGVYYPGLEDEIYRSTRPEVTGNNPEELCKRIIKDYSRMNHRRHGSSIAEVYEPYLDWKYGENAAMILVMCYSGFRVSAYVQRDFEVNLEEGYFRGGIKTESGRNRVVPIHSAIRPLVESMMEGERPVFFGGKSVSQFRRDMKSTLRKLGLPERTPHSCRHTFSRLCESYGVREADRKRMLGHSFGSDITNGVYGRRTLDELRVEIEKIKVPEITHER